MLPCNKHINSNHNDSCFPAINCNLVNRTVVTVAARGHGVT